MSFKNLKVDELRDVAEFFVVDVESVNPDKPTKKELLAALASGDEPVTWEQYNQYYLPNSGNDNAEQTVAAKEAEKKSSGDTKAATELVQKTTDDSDEPEQVLVKYERKNPTFQVVGYTFNKRHPFAAVPPEIAEHLVRNVPGFRLALASEAVDYYR